MTGAASGALAAILLMSVPVPAPTPSASPSRTDTPRSARRSSTSRPALAPAPAAPKKVAGIRAPRSPLAPGDRISLDLKDADIRDVVRTFAELAHVNVVIDPDVRGSVTVRLQDVRWEDALDVILRSNGLGAVREDSLMRVGSPARLAGETAR